MMLPFRLTYIYVRYSLYYSLSILKCFEMEKYFFKPSLAALELIFKALCTVRFWSKMMQRILELHNNLKNCFQIKFSCISVHLTCSVSSSLCNKTEPTQGCSSSFPPNWALPLSNYTHPLCSGNSSQYYICEKIWCGVIFPMGWKFQVFGKGFLTLAYHSKGS